MYFRVGCTLSPTVLYILPHNFAMVSPLSRQLNKVQKAYILVLFDKTFLLDSKRLTAF
jgi:hypothetical protein